MKYRKRPIVIDAWPTVDLLRAAKKDWSALPVQVRDAYERGEILFLCDGLTISTLEGAMTAELDDWVICGVKGELYPCKPDVFAAAYDAEQEADHG